MMYSLIPSKRMTPLQDVINKINADSGVTVFFDEDSKNFRLQLIIQEKTRWRGSDSIRWQWNCPFY